MGSREIRSPPWPVASPPQPPAPSAACALAACALAAASLSFASAAQAVPRSAPRPTTQVNGNKLKTALVPAASLGSRYAADGPPIDSGAGLELSPAFRHISGMSCATFETAIAVDGYGETAFVVGTASSLTTGYSYEQGVHQFKTAGAAASFYSAAYAKYGSCRSFSEPAPGGGSTRTVTTSVSKEHVGGYQAFVVSQGVTFTALRGPAIPDDTLMALDGTDVCTVTTIGGQGGLSLSQVTAKLIRRVLGLR